jgi:hypothetical protein
MDLPGVGHVGGEWDLRGREEEYLGGVDLRGKRVLEVGTASGHLCFYMEREGADVVAFDLSENESWDIVPYQRYDWEGALLGRRLHVKRVNNAFWLAHGAFRSKAKMVYGSVYAIPREIGSVDITTFGSILVHVRDPFFALQNALSLTRETVVVTEAYSLPRKALDTVRGSHISFMPDFLRCEPKEAWWHLSPRVIQRFLGVLGFEKYETTYQYQKGRVRKGRVEDKSHRHRFFTIVGHRTQGLQRFEST